MTYGQFLVVFLAIPIVGLAVAIWRRRSRLTRGELTAFVAISVVALVYTTPWDNLIIGQAVWSYPGERILGLMVGRVPLEECLFYVLQVALVGLFWKWRCSVAVSEAEGEANR